MGDGSGRGNSWSKGRNKVGLFPNRWKAGLLDQHQEEMACRQQHGHLGHARSGRGVGMLA